MGHVPSRQRCDGRAASDAEQRTGAPFSLLVKMDPNTILDFLNVFSSIFVFLWPRFEDIIGQLSTELEITPITYLAAIWKITLRTGVNFKLFFRKWVITREHRFLNHRNFKIYFRDFYFLFTIQCDHWGHCTHNFRNKMIRENIGWDRIPNPWDDNNPRYQSYWLRCSMHHRIVSPH